MTVVNNAGINAQLREAYGPALQGSPAFARLLISTNTSANITPESDTVFVEHNPRPLGPAFAALKGKGMFTVARVDTALILDQAPQLYNAAVQAGANLLVSDFIVPQEFDDTNYTVQLPCNDPEFCDIS
ncbi:MAG: hypothetical protein HC767_05245 [Akkermansiaceae bacterium]|nr:hypothetical protein [Akkermansiaceae bacterium]